MGGIGVMANDDATLRDGESAIARGPCRHAPAMPWLPVGNGGMRRARHDISALPTALQRTDAGLRGLTLPPAVAIARRLLIVGAGASLHAAAVGRGWMAQYSGLPCDIAPAEAWRERGGAPAPGTVAVLLCPSGEAPAMRAVAEAMHARGVPVVAITEARACRLARGAALAWPTQARSLAGDPAGAASAAGFAVPLLALLRLGLALGTLRGAVDAGPLRQADRALGEAPLACALAEAAEARLTAIAHRVAHAGRVVLLGHGWAAPLAALGAERLRLLARVAAVVAPDAEACGGGAPAILLADGDRRRAAPAAAALRAGGGHVVALVDSMHAAAIAPDCSETVALPGPWPAQIFAQAVALQLIAYHAALALGHDGEAAEGAASA